MVKEIECINLTKQISEKIPEKEGTGKVLVVEKSKTRRNIN